MTVRNLLSALSPTLQIHNKKNGATTIPIKPKLDIISSKMHVVNDQPIGSGGIFSIDVTKYTAYGNGLSSQLLLGTKKVAANRKDCPRYSKTISFSTYSL